MESPRGRSRASVAEALFAAPYRFDFFQAVRLVGRFDPERKANAGEADPDGIRFTSVPSLAFPPSQIAELAEGEDGVEMRVAFMGLIGPLGILPSHYTETAIERNRSGDRSLSGFLDAFLHRWVALFYRAWEKYRFPIQVEKSRAAPFTRFLFSCFGMGTPGLADRLTYSDAGLLFFGGLIAQQPRSAAALTAVLTGYFGVPVSVEQFRGTWLKLDPTDLTVLGGARGRLGIDCFAGTRVWDRQAAFRLRLGPLDYARFLHFLPTGGAFRPLGDLTRFLVGLEFDFDVQPVLAAKEVPDAVLAANGDYQPLLGWTTWLKTRPREADADGVVLTIKENSK